MKKAVFTAMAVLSLPVFLSACSLFEKNSDDKTLPAKSPAPAVTPSVPETKSEAPKKEAVKAPVTEEVKKAEPVQKQETVKTPAAEVTKTPDVPKKQETVEVPVKKEVEKAESPKKEEVVKAPAAEPEKIKLPCTYVVKTNDSLWRLAVDYYGKGAKWTLIYKANKNKIKNPDHLEPGTELTIPAPSQNQ